MTFKARARSALMISAGLLICFGGISQATSAAARETKATAKPAQIGAPVALKKTARHHKRHSSKHASARRLNNDSSRMASRANLRHRHYAEIDLSETDDRQSALEPEVANANAQASVSETANAGQSATPGDADQAAQPPVAASQIVGADRLNDADLTLSPGPVVARPFTYRSVVSDNDSSEQASLLGKIFVAFGSLLTLASAARMFMA